MDIERETKPPGTSWVLDASELAEATEVAGVSASIRLRYTVLGPQLGCTYSPNTDTFIVETGAFEGEGTPQFKSDTSNLLLPRLVKWMLEVCQLPHNSTRRLEEPHFSGYSVDSDVEVVAT